MRTKDAEFLWDLLRNKVKDRQLKTFAWRIIAKEIEINIARGEYDDEHGTEPTSTGASFQEYGIQGTVGRIFVHPEESEGGEQSAGD